MSHRKETTPESTNQQPNPVDRAAELRRKLAESKAPDKQPQQQRKQERKLEMSFRLTDAEAMRLRQLAAMLDRFVGDDVDEGTVKDDLINHLIAKALRDCRAFAEDTFGLPYYGDYGDPE